MIKLKNITDRRAGEIVVHFMAYEPIVRKIWQARYKMDYRDWNSIFYIAWMYDEKGFYTIEDFNSYSTIHNWKPNRNESYIEEGWCKLYYDGSRKKGETSKWILTQKGKLMITEYYNFLVGAIPIPETKRFNKLMKDKYKVPAVELMAGDREFMTRYEENNN